MDKLLRACGRGSQAACEIAQKLRIMYAASVLKFDGVDTDKHPNKMPFKGCLLLIDEPSQKAPHGSQGHRIFVSKKAAEENLEGILGMAVNYDRTSLGEHATRNKVGVINKAWIDDNKVMVSGFIWYHDFPEAERALKGRTDLGMSMELADVYVEDEDASVWNLTKFNFTGATILKRKAAAYTNTTLAAKAAATREGEEQMSKKIKEEKSTAAADRDKKRSKINPSLLAAAIGGQVTTAVQNLISPVVNELKASNQQAIDTMNELGGRLRLLEINAAADDEADDDEIVLNAGSEEESSDEDGIEAGAEESSDDEDEIQAAGDDDDSSSSEASSEEDDEIDAALEDMGKQAADPAPGHINKNAKNKGNKTTVTDPPTQGTHFPGSVAEGRLNASAKKGRKDMGTSRAIDAAALQIQELHASNRKLTKLVKQLHANGEAQKKSFNTKFKKMHAQLEHFTEQEGRRSHMPAELTNLASKVGVDLRELKASGQKLSVEACDEMFGMLRDKGINLSVQDRMGMKMNLEDQGLLDQGLVDRSYRA